MKNRWWTSELEPYQAETASSYSARAWIDRSAISRTLPGHAVWEERGPFWWAQTRSLLPAGVVIPPDGSAIVPVEIDFWTAPGWKPAPGLAIDFDLRLGREPAARTARDERRLRDGASALREPTNYEAMSIKELRALRERLGDGARALQSMDDLGSPEANQRAWADMQELMKRLAAVEATIASRGTKTGGSQRS